MAQLSREKQQSKTRDDNGEQSPSRGQLILREGALIGWLSVCAYLLLAFISYTPSDPGWSHTGVENRVENAAGPMGAWLSDVFFSLFGYISYLFPILLAVRAWGVFRAYRQQRGGFDGVVFALRILGLILVMSCATSLVALHYGSVPTSLPFGVGGILGASVSAAASTAFSFVGSTLILLAIFLFGLTVFTDLSWMALIDGAGRLTLRGLELVRHSIADYRARREEARHAEVAQSHRREVKAKRAEKEATRIPPTIQTPVKQESVSVRVQKERQSPLFDEPVSGSFYPGTQGLVGSADGTALITLHSREKQSVRMHDLRSYRILNNLELDINAAGVTRLDGDAHGTPMFILTNYDQPTVTLIDANLTSVRTLKLPNVFQNLVGIAMIQGDFAVLPSRSHRVVGFLSAGEVPSLQIVPVELDDDIFSSSAIPYGVAVIRGCIVLNYREDRKLAVGRLSAMGVIITKVFDTDLDHPQSMAVNNERLYVLETGSHSLLVYDFVSQRRHRILLPKGAFRGMTVTQSGEVFVSGQKFGEAEKNNTNFNSVLDENKVGIYKVLGTRRLTHTLVHQTPVPER